MNVNIPIPKFVDLQLARPSSVDKEWCEKTVDNPGMMIHLGRMAAAALSLALVRGIGLGPT